MRHPVKFVVEHVEDGTEQGSISWFKNPKAKVSAHFLIANDGTLHQAVDTDDVAWAEAAFNPVAWSVETEGVPAEALTNAQIATFGRLLAWLQSLDRFPMVTTDDPNGAGGLITHGALGEAGGGHIGCPGPIRAAQRQQILALAKEYKIPPTKEEAVTIVIEPQGICERNETSGWAFGRRGHVYSFGDAPYLGGWDDNTRSGDRDCVGMVCTESGNGYWLVSNHGEVFAFGDALYPGNYDGKAWGAGEILGAVRNEKQPNGGLTLIRDDGKHLNLYALPS